MDCEKWFADLKKGIFKNPETNRKIKEDGPVYKKLMKKCSSKNQSPKKTKKSSSKKLDCEQWKSDLKKGIFKNPETNRKIKQDGPVYKKLMKKCSTKKQSPKKSSPKKPSPKKVQSDEQEWRKKMKHVMSNEDKVKKLEEKIQKVKSKYEGIPEFESIVENVQYLKKKFKPELLNWAEVKLMKY